MRRKLSPSTESCSCSSTCVSGPDGATNDRQFVLVKAIGVCLIRLPDSNGRKSNKCARRLRRKTSRTIPSRGTDKYHVAMQHRSLRMVVSGGTAERVCRKDVFLLNTVQPTRCYTRSLKPRIGNGAKVCWTTMVGCHRNSFCPSAMS